MLSDQLVAAVLDAPTAKLELRVPLSWSGRPTTVRAELGVHNTHGLPLRAGLQVVRDKPWKVTVYLMLYGTHLRRLDVNGSHRNRTDGQDWNYATHKHKFSEERQDAVAYTPEGMPAVPFTYVSDDHYRRVWEAFCVECGIRFGGAYAWQASPPLISPNMGGSSVGGAP